MAAPEIWQASPLFEAVQRGRVFSDGKTFLDCVPRRPLEHIVADYERAIEGRATAAFDLRAFVSANFDVPPAWEIAAPSGTDIGAYIDSLWKLLRRPPDRAIAGSTLLPLSHPYIVPGGRFREIYYWDSYFTMLGLRESGDEEMILHMLRNFASLIDAHGFIPNGNRRYYLSRSQPPYFALMVELAAERQPDVLCEFRESLQAEYDFWMDRTRATQHVVTLPDGAVLNRYWDQLDTPRPESLLEDETVAARSATGRESHEIWRDLRSAAESGWDFSSRWLDDAQRLETIATTRFVPVDLNCLLHRHELVLALAHERAGDFTAARRLRAAAAARARAIDVHLWSPESGFHFDFDLATGRRSRALTLAGAMPLFLRLASDAQARRAATVLESTFLRPGGLVTTTVRSGQQWDAPNGWAPLQWIAVQGLRHYGCEALAQEVASRWLRLNLDTFRHTGRLMEKYNVVGPGRGDRGGGGGEYAPQHGFGWTNGVLLALRRVYPASES